MTAPKKSKRAVPWWIGAILSSIILMAAFVVFTGVGIPEMSMGRMQSRDASALKSLNAINTACILYQATYQTYPHALSDLGPADKGGPTKTAADLLNSDIAQLGGGPAIKDGYIFRYVAGVADEKGNIQSYKITADPTMQDKTAVRRFYMDQTGNVHLTSDGTPATAQSPPLQ